MKEFLKEYFESKQGLDHKYMNEAEKDVFLKEMERLLEEGDIDVKNGDTVYFNGGPMKLCDLFSIAMRFFNLRF